MLRSSVACTVLLLGAALPATSSTAAPANLLPSSARTADAVVVNVASRQRRSRPRDCTPTNGPFGFYGNIWCEPPSQAQYIRNLGAGWPMKTPRALSNPKPSSNDTDW